MLFKNEKKIESKISQEMVLMSMYTVLATFGFRVDLDIECRNEHRDRNMKITLWPLESCLTSEIQLAVHAVNVEVGVELYTIDLGPILEPTSLWTASWVFFIIIYLCLYVYVYILNCCRSLFEPVFRVKSKIKYNKEIACILSCSYYNFFLCHFASTVLIATNLPHIFIALVT